MKIFATPAQYYRGEPSCDCGEFGCYRCSEPATFYVLESEDMITSTDVIVSCLSKNGAGTVVSVSEIEEMIKKGKEVVIL